MTDLGTPPGYPEGAAGGINAAGQVVGYSSGIFGRRAVVWMDGMAVPLAEAYSEAKGINDLGQIVGGRWEDNRPASWHPCVFTGFFKPLENKDAQGRHILNQVKAGAAVPVKFRLSGNHGLDIFAAGFPKSVPIACEPAAAVDPVESTLTAGQSSLSYDSATDQYTYIWKTEKSWTGCRLLTVRLKTGQEHMVIFKFTK